MSDWRAGLREWRTSPNRFVRQVLRVEPDAWQDEVLLAAAAGVHGVGNAVNPEAKKRLALKASKGPGKSTVLAWIGWWFLSCFTHPKVVATSISGDNLKDGLWTELAKWQLRSPEFLMQWFTWQAERILCNDHPTTWWASARQWSKSASADQQANTLAGIHADNVLILVDESGGIPDGVVAAAEAGLANADPAHGKHALLCQAGNPTHLTGPLYRACTRERTLWWVKEISGDPDDPGRAPRVSIQWAREQIQKFGADNPWVLINVFGKFPPGQSNTLIGVEDAVEASRRKLREGSWEGDPKVLGVDVARFGDDESDLVLRQGHACFRPKAFRNIDTMRLAGEVALVIEKEQVDATFIDVGAMGAGVYDRLIQLGFKVVGVDFGGKPWSPKYLNRRAEMWFSMAEWVKTRGCIPDDAQLISELPAPTYSFSPDGKLKLESKEDMKKRGVPSPNRADALCLTFAAPVAPKGMRDQLERLQHARATADGRPAWDYDPFKGG